MAKDDDQTEPAPPAEKPEPAPDTDWVHSIEIKRLRADEPEQDGRE